MAFEKYFIELIKQDGPSQQTKVLVPFSPAMSVSSTEGLIPAPRSADIADASITAAKLASGAATPAKTINTEAGTATSDGLTTGIISDTSSHVTVTSANADHIIVLPAPTPGRMIVINVGANGFELRSSAPATIAINGGTASNAESAIAANSTIIAICISATAWKAIFLDADGDVAKVEAAA